MNNQRCHPPAVLSMLNAAPSIVRKHQIEHRDQLHGRCWIEQRLRRDLRRLIHDNDDQGTPQPTERPRPSSPTGIGIRRHRAVSRRAGHALHPRISRARSASRRIRGPEFVERIELALVPDLLDEGHVDVSAVGITAPVEYVRFEDYTVPVDGRTVADVRHPVELRAIQPADLHGVYAAQRRTISPNRYVQGRKSDSAPALVAAANSAAHRISSP